jgi:hypothetical protein
VKPVLALSLMLGSPVLSASSDVKGHVSTYTSPLGTDEHCIALSHFPGGTYSASDSHQENKFCAIDFYDKSVALCPKFFSTSPGTLIYDISTGPYAGDPGGFESSICPRGKIMHKEANGAPVSFKTTMNGKKTSATFSTASLLYYHFSRYFDTNIQVPVSVYRSMDRKLHLKRVTKPGVRYSSHRKSLHMNHAAWLEMEHAEKNPESYHPVDELFSKDRKRIYGIFIHPHGKRYNAEINGTRRSGWGEGQNRDFQNTAPFLALRSDAPVLGAIRKGLDKARHDDRLRKAMGSHVSTAQTLSWMQDLTEITLLDYIFSQQDRIGNIDYLEYWYWIDGNQIQHRPAHGKTIPADIREYKPLRLKRTLLNDNDAGGHLSYVNYTKRTGMLEKIRHYNPDIYRQLLKLDTDFMRKGSLYNYVATTFGLSERQLKMVVDNTHSAAKILKDSCRKGRLRFDLDLAEFLLHQDIQPKKVACDG